MEAYFQVYELFSISAVFLLLVIWQTLAHISSHLTVQFDY